MSFKPMEAEFVPQAFRACLGTAPQGCSNLAQSIRSRDQIGVCEPELRPRTGCYSASGSLSEVSSGWYPRHSRVSSH